MIRFKSKDEHSLATKPDAVLFDLDDTLYPFAEPHALAMNEVRDKVGRLLGVSPRDFDEAYERARAETKAQLGPVASSHSRLLYFQRLIELLGMKTRVVLALDLEQTYWRTVLLNTSLFPGVMDILIGLRSLGIPSVAVTNLTAQIQFRKIVYLGLDSYFDFVVTSEEAGADKPDPTPFKLALEKLALPETLRVWMVGGSATDDIAGAKQHMGAITMQKVHRGVEVAEDGVDVVFDNFNELTGPLSQWTAALRHGDSGASSR